MTPRDMRSRTRIMQEKQIHNICFPCNLFFPLLSSIASGCYAVFDFLHHTISTLYNLTGSFRATCAFMLRLSSSLSPSLSLFILYMNV